MGILARIGTNVAVFTGTVLGAMLVFKGADMVVEAVSKKKKKDPETEDEDVADNHNATHGYE